MYDPLALNYNNQATVDDGSCTYVVPDDVDIPKGTLPYFRSMTLRDSAGVLLTSSVLTDSDIESNPLLYYRNQDDYEYQQTILA